MNSNRRKEDQPLDKPNQNSNVWPKQTCPAFTLRESTTVATPECWYCQYADFRLNQPKPVEVGICCWPKKVI